MSSQISNIKLISSRSLRYGVASLPDSISGGGHGVCVIPHTCSSDMWRVKNKAKSFSVIGIAANITMHGHNTNITTICLGQLPGFFW
jgi:hypothetical protein